MLDNDFTKVEANGATLPLNVIQLANNNTKSGLWLVPLFRHPIKRFL